MGGPAGPIQSVEVELTEGAIRNAYVPVTATGDFFPRDAFGSRAGPAGRPITLLISGLDTPVETDIAEVAFRARAPWRAFFRDAGVQPGDRLRITREAERVFRVDDAPASNGRGGVS